MATNDLPPQFHTIPLFTWGIKLDGHTFMDDPWERVSIDLQSSPTIQALIQNIVTSATTSPEIPLLQTILRILYSHFSIRFVHANRNIPDKPVETDLEAAVSNRYKDCMYDTLTAAVIIEHLKLLGYLESTVEMRLANFHADRFSHIWLELRPTVESPTVVLDIVEGFVGNEVDYKDKVLNPMIADAFY